MTLGIGQDNIRKIATDDAFRMRVDALHESMESDRRAGKKPFCVVPTVGTTSTSSIDPVDAIADVAQEYGAWLHVDAAYSGIAAVVPELRSILAGTERAHSVVVNPHKWLFTPIDLSAFYTRKPDILRRAFSLVPEYLKTAEDSRAVNFMDYGVQLGRRFRALKLWFVMRHYGHAGIAEMIRTHIRYAQDLAALIRSHPDFELSAPVPFSLILFPLSRFGSRQPRIARNRQRFGQGIPLPYGVAWEAGAPFGNRKYGDYLGRFDGSLEFGSAGSDGNALITWFSVAETHPPY